MNAARSVVLKDIDGNDCYPKTTYSNIIGLAYVTDNGVRVYFGNGAPSTDATQFEDIDENSIYFDTNLSERIGICYRVDSIINDVITWDKYGYFAGDGIKIQNNKILSIPEYLITNEVEYDEDRADGLFRHTDGGIGSTGSRYCHSKKAVSLNDTLAIRASSYNYNRIYSAITYLDSDNNVIGYYPENETDEALFQLKNHIITITDPRIAYIVVNGRIPTNPNGNERQMPYIRNTEPLNVNELIDKKTSYLADIPSFIDDTELATDIRQGQFVWANASIDSGSANTMYAKIPINWGDIYYISGKTLNYGSRYRCINILDSNGDLLETYPKENLSTATEVLLDFKYIIKQKNAAYMVINGNPGGISIKKGVPTTVEKYVENIATDKSYLTDFINMADMIKRVRDGGKDFVWKPFDTGYITIIYDDGSPSLSTASDIFEEYNMPLCAAMIPRNLGNISDDGERTIKQVCDDIVANGGEILSHDGPVLHDPTDYETIKENLMKTKEQLTNAGFIIRGFMKPGGTGMIDWRNTNMQRFTQMFYDYADQCGETAQYYKPRKALSDIAQVKEYIDDAMANNKWYTFFCHDFTELSESGLREILNYAQLKGVTVTTYAHMYDTFGSWEDVENE